MLDRKVTVVSNNIETLTGVQTYLHRAGARLSSAARLEDASRVAASADAVVFFADDYPQAAALGAFAGLRRALPAALLVVVTGELEAFTPPAPNDGGASRVVVLQRPAWGWMLVDAIRSGTALDVGGAAASGAVRPAPPRRNRSTRERSR